MSSSTTVPFPDIPSLGLSSIPRTPIIEAAVDFLKQHTNEAVYNHCMRSAYFALLLLKKFEDRKNNNPLAGADPETLVLACVLHDMGWTTSKELTTNYRRFEVDGADIARRFVEDYRKAGGVGAEDWDLARVQKVWDVIALHTIRSIAPYGSPEVAAGHLGVMVEFCGPRFPRDPWAPSTSSEQEGEEGAVITEGEYKAVVRMFPYAGFGTAEMVREVFCSMCRDKPAATYDNFVASFGREFGIDGKGGGRDEYRAAWEAANATDLLTGNFGYLLELVKEGEK